MGTHPNDYLNDRVMGVTAVGSQESVRFGEENDPETEDVLDRAAHSSEDLDKTCKCDSPPLAPSQPRHCPTQVSNL